MATGDAIDYGWYTYTRDNSETYSVKTDKTWGDSAASGLGAFNAALAPIHPHGRLRLRKVILQDPVSGRKTTRVLGVPAAPAGTPGTTVATKARGASGAWTLTSLGVIPERWPKSSVILSKAEPITT